MDVVSHGLWSVVAGRLAGRRTSVPSYGWRWFLWGAFPDLFAFGPAFLWLFGSLLVGHISFSDLPMSHERSEPPDLVRYPVFRLAPELYELSHSLFVCAAVLALVYLVYRHNPAQLAKIWRPMWAWGLHIVMDVPTHSYAFYPTPLLFPFSDWKFNGISWGQPWFMALDAFLLCTVFLTLRLYGRKVKVTRQTYG